MQQLLNDFVFHALGSVASFAKVLSTLSSTPGHGNCGCPAPQDSPLSSYLLRAVLNVPPTLPWLFGHPVVFRTTLLPALPANKDRTEAPEAGTRSHRAGAVLPRRRKGPAENSDVCWGNTTWDNLSKTKPVLQQTRSQRQTIYCLFICV